MKVEQLRQKILRDLWNGLYNIDYENESHRVRLGELTQTLRDDAEILEKLEGRTVWPRSSSRLLYELRETLRGLAPNEERIFNPEDLIDTEDEEDY